MIAIKAIVLLLIIGLSACSLQLAKPAVPSITDNDFDVVETSELGGIVEVRCNGAVCIATCPGSIVLHDCFYWGVGCDHCACYC